MANILVGCDPEVFVKQNGKFLSAHGLIPGDKKNPHKVDFGAVQVDGMALEFNIDAAASQDEFVFNVQSVFDTMCRMVPDYEVVATPVADFSFAYLDAQPAAALELGCDPDYNGWTGETNPRPNGRVPMRTASGHIHVGWTSGQDKNGADHIRDANMVVKSLDFFLGLPSLVYDADARRREMYGKAGACRYKEYGVEYRTLSNRWLSSPALMAWVYRATIAGTQAIMNGRDLAAKYGDIQEIINTSNIKEAEKIIKAEKLEVCYA